MILPAFFRARRNAPGPAPHRLARFPAGALALAAATCLAAPAGAEDVLHAPDAIRACLCREQSVASLARAMADERRTHDEAQQRFQSLSAEADAARQKLDPNDAGARDALGRLLEQRDAAQDQLAAAVPPLNDAVERYNGAVNAFNSDCAGKGYDPAVLAEVKTSLTCPPEALPPPRS